MNNSRNLVSVIIPTYNRAVRCRTAVESVLSQTHHNVEVVVVDDGSVDNTRETIANLDDRVKYIYQPNAGVSAARNTGLKAATGDYVAFLDSDDMWLPWKLEAQLSVLKHFPGAGMVWTDMQAVDENGVTLHESYLKLMYSAYKYFNRETCFQTIRPLSDMWDGCPTIYSDRKSYFGNIFSWMFMGNLVHTSTVLLRRERQEKVGFFDVDLIKSGEDYDFHFRTCKEGDVAYVDVPSIRYQVGGTDQLTQPEHMIWIARNNMKTINKMFSTAKDSIVLPRKMIRSHLAWSYAWVGLTEFKEDPATARHYLIKSLQLSPFQMKIAAYFALSYLSPEIVEKLRDSWQKVKRLTRLS